MSTKPPQFPPSQGRTVAASPQYASFLWVTGNTAVPEVAALAGPAAKDVAGLCLSKSFGLGSPKQA